MTKDRKAPTTNSVMSVRTAAIGQKLDAISSLAFEEVVDEVRQSWGAEPFDA